MKARTALTKHQTSSGAASIASLAQTVKQLKSMLLNGFEEEADRDAVVASIGACADLIGITAELIYGTPGVYGDAAAWLLPEGDGCAK